MLEFFSTKLFFYKNDNSFLTEYFWDNKRYRYPTLVLFILFYLLFSCIPTVHAENNKFKVLVLHSYHHGFEWTDRVMAGIESVFNKSDVDIELLTEYMDTKYHKPEILFSHLQELYAAKYHKMQPDIIISSDNNALNFLLSNRELLFPSVPVVFCGINNYSDSLIKNQVNMTGVAEDFDIEGTIDLALHLHPETRQIAVISDSTHSSIVTLESMKRLFPKFTDRVSFVELTGLTAQEFKEALNRLPDESLVIYNGLYRDCSNRTFTKQEGLAFVVKNSQVAVYTLCQLMVDQGVLGGVVVNGFSQGEQAALMAARILQGESPDHIPVYMKVLTNDCNHRLSKFVVADENDHAPAMPVIETSPNAPVFDYNAMVQFGINRSDLPENSIVLNMPSSLYTDYRNFFWITIAVIFSLLFFIFKLLTNIRVRKRVEQELKKSEYKIKTILDNAAIHIWAHDGKRLLYISKEWYRYTGQNPSQPLTFKRWTEIVHPDDLEKTVKILQQTWKDKSACGHCLLLKHRKGEYRWMFCRAVPVFDENGEFIHFVGFNIDIHELMESEGQCRAIIQTAIDGFWMVDTKGRLIDVNEASCKMLGYNREELLQMKISDINAIKIEEEAARHIQKVIKKGRDSFETQHRCKDGTIINVQINGQYLNIKQGLFVVFIKDITEKVANLQALENSEKRYRNLFDGAPVMYVTAAKNRKGFPVVTDCNKLFLRVLGYKRTDVVGKPLALFYTDELQKKIMKETYYKRDMENLLTMHERELKTYDGSGINTLLQAVPEYDTQGNVIGTRIMFVDISAQVRAEEQLIESQNLLQMIVDGISDPMIMVDKNMNVLMQNMATMKYYGIDYEKNCLSRKCYEVFNENSNPCEGCTIPQAVSNLRHLTFERKGFMDPEKLEQITIYPIKDKDHGWAAIIRIDDITKTRLMERELIQADKMISLGILVSGVAHEINNPNNFIMMNGALLSEVWEDIVPVIEKYYKKNGDFVLAGLPYSEIRNEIPLLFKGIIEGTQRIKQIVEDLKDYARQNGSDLKQSVNINKVIKRAIRLNMDLIKKSTGKFKVEYGKNLPLIKGNRQKFEQVAINLIQNACQALVDKGKGVFIKSSFDKEKGNIVVQVQDEGCGIPEMTLARIMDPFFTTRRGQGGTGLGLSVSLTIVKAHGGRIEVASKIAKGTTFKVVLPVNRIKKSVKILVADDDSR